MDVRTRFAVALASTLAMIGCVSPGLARAASATATGTVSAGSLALSTSSSPSFSVTLNGTDQTPTYTVPITVTDSRGSGGGWNATITSTQFSTGGATPNLLSTSASTATGVTSSCAQGTCTNPTNSISFPVSVPAGSTPPTAVKLFNSANNTGMGQFTVTPTVQVAVPANAFAGSYTSTLTLSAVAGP